MARSNQLLVELNGVSNWKKLQKGKKDFGED